MNRRLAGNKPLLPMRQRHSLNVAKVRPLDKARVLPSATALPLNVTGVLPVGRRRHAGVATRVEGSLSSGGR